MDLIYIQGVVFPALLSYLLLASVSLSLHIHAKVDFNKKKVIFLS